MKESDENEDWLHRRRFFLQRKGQKEQHRYLNAKSSYVVVLTEQNITSSFECQCQFDDRIGGHRFWKTGLEEAARFHYK